MGGACYRRGHRRLGSARCARVGSSDNARVNGFDAAVASDPGCLQPAGLLDSGRAWSAVAAAFMAMFTVFGVAYSFGAFFTSMAEEFHAGSGATSAVFSVTAFLYFSMGLVSGAVADRVGPRKV